MCNLAIFMSRNT